MDCLTICPRLAASLMLLASALLKLTNAAFTSQARALSFTPKRHFMSSFVGDGSDYSSKDSDFDDDDDMMETVGGVGYREGAETPTIELSPIPMSKNSGNRFVAFVWDRELDTEARDALELHYDHIARTEDHVMYCRKRNLYNETFNTDSMVDILWSYSM